MSNKETIRFHSYALPVIQIVKYVDSEAPSGNVMYDLYLNGKREQRYDASGLLYRLELIIRLAGIEIDQKGENYVNQSQASSFYEEDNSQTEGSY